jgi:hypothetical protein
MSFTFPRVLNQDRVRAFEAVPHRSQPIKNATVESLFVGDVVPVGRVTAIPNFTKGEQLFFIASLFAIDEFENGKITAGSLRRSRFSVCAFGCHKNQATH